MQRIWDFEALKNCNEDILPPCNLPSYKKFQNNNKIWTKDPFPGSVVITGHAQKYTLTRCHLVTFIKGVQKGKKK